MQKFDAFMFKAIFLLGAIFFLLLFGSKAIVPAAACFTIFLISIIAK